MQARARGLFVVALALTLAGLACNLRGGGRDTDEVPVVVPVFDVATITPASLPTVDFVIATPTFVPAVEPLPAVLPATPVNCMPVAGWPVYAVRAGDTLGVIAEASGTTVEQLAAANCLARVDLIFVDQQLFVPQLPAAPVAPPAVQVIVATPNPSAPVFIQVLTADQHWIDPTGRPITHNSTVRVNAGEVRDADIVSFYVNDPLGTGAILFGQDADPWDGAFADYAFPAPGTYTFQAVAQNELARANSTVFTIIYDPNFRPPPGT